MNLARLVVIDKAPAIVIFAKTHGTHSHADIPGFTHLESGAATCVRFEGESIPDMRNKEEVTTWLINKAQAVMGMIIEARSWDDQGTIDIMRIVQPGRAHAQPAVTAA